MTQFLTALGLSGGGIVVVLFIMGIVLIVSKIETTLGYFAIIAAVVIAVIMGILGIIGIVSKYK